MGKVEQVAIVVGTTAILYIFMLVVMPIMTDFATSANATMQATSNMSNYPGAAEAPFVGIWALWFVPVAISLAVIVGILKRK